MNLIKQLWRMFHLTRRAGGWRAALGIVRNAPKYVTLFGRLLADTRVPVWSKAIFVAAIVFAFSPVNLPSIIPVIGALDEIGITLFAGNFFLKQVPSHILAEHRRASGFQETWDVA